MYYIADSHHMKAYFAGRTSAAYAFYLQMHGASDIQHYAIDSML